MGIRNVHLVFILVAIITAIAFGLWCFVTRAGRETTGSTIMGIVSFGAAAGLIAYAVRFLRKIQHGDY